MVYHSHESYFVTTNSDHYDHLGGLLEQDSAGKVDGLHHQLDQAWQPGSGQSIEVCTDMFSSFDTLTLPLHNMN